MNPSGLLEVELKTFQSHREEWLRDHPGTYVAIQGDQAAGFYGSYAEAFTAGLHRFGGDRNFLIKEVWRTEPVYFVF